MKGFWDRPAVRFVREMTELYFEKHVARASAALVYWLILSLFPILICISAFIGLLRVDPLSVRGALDFLPGGLLEVVESYLSYVTENQSTALFLVGAFSAVFFAAAAMRSLMIAMSEIYERKGLVSVGRFAASLLISVLLLAAIYLSMAVVLTGTRLFRTVEERLGVRWLAWLLELPALKFLALFGVVFLLVALIYQVVSPPGEPRAPVFRGALLASAALAAGSGAFSVFIGMSSRYSLVYGPLLSVVVLLLWLYLCGNILILGGIFNCVLAKHRQEKNIAKKLDKSQPL